MNIYDRIEVLCKSQGITITELCRKVNISRSVLSELKAGRTARISTDKCLKISDFFNVPVEFILGAPPFDVWEIINANREGFFYYIPLSSEKLKAIWGIDKDNPDAASIRQIVGFISSYIADIRADDDGNWIITPKDGFDTEKKNPVTGDASDRFSPDNAALAYALWGGDTEGIDDQDIEDVRRFAAFIREKKKKQ